jgi:steroid 5-alpha reductase family enzyme
MTVWTALALTAAAVLALMLAAWGVGLRRGRHDGVDVVWGAGFGMVALVTMAVSDGPLWIRLLVTTATVVWGGRLAWHIGRRNHGRPQDRRYVAMMARAGGNPAVYALTRVYLTQGVIMWVVSLPVQVAQFGPVGLRPLVVLGAVVWAVGFGFETVGDEQLRRFRADPANRGQVMDRGLWRYTRHPNYFGDACVWWGLFLMACHQWPGLLTVVSPIVMTVLLTRVSGAALLERGMASRRPGYAEYVARTSGFLPLPPRKGRAA